MKSAEDVIRSSNSVANSVLNDILKATNVTPSKEKLPRENTEENPDKAAGSTPKDSLPEKKRSEQFKVPPTPKPSRASMTDQSGRDRRYNKNLTKKECYIINLIYNFIEKRRRLRQIIYLKLSYLIYIYVLCGI